MEARADDWELTANHYVAIPLIAKGTGAIHSITALQRGANAVIEWAGGADRMPGALLTPAVTVDNRTIPFESLAWDRLDRWIPRFRTSLGEELALTGTVCAPVGYEATRRGFVYAFEIENHGSTERNVTVSLRGSWRSAARIVCGARPMVGERVVVKHAQREGIALELNGPASAALGLAVYGSGTEMQVDAHDSEAFSLARSVRVGPGRRVSVSFFCGLAQEREGALATAAAMRRLGAERLIRETRLELSRMARKTPDAGLTALLNRNLLFCFFYGAARALDDDRLYPVTSRSPLHPRCGTFNERDALLWALPAIALCDHGLAREYILRSFEQYSHRPGESVRYIDGTVLEPGLALDQWCAYALAVDHYIRATEDESLLDEPLIRDVFRELDLGLYARLHPEVFLGATELFPSGEPAAEPYATYHNALLHAVCRILHRLAAPESEEAKRLANAMDELSAAVWRKLTVDVRGEALLAWSTDLADAASVYDDPAGSLQLLPYYGFCEQSEPVWRSTMNFLRSPSYKLWLGDRKVPGLAARGTPTRASTAGLCADLLGTRSSEALSALRTVIFMSSVGQTHYDVDTGQGSGAVHDAGIAGFLAWSLYHTLSE